MLNGYMRECGLLTQPLALVADGCMGQRSPVPWNNTNFTNALISSSDRVPGHSAENVRRRTGTLLVPSRPLDPYYSTDLMHVQIIFITPLFLVYCLRME